MKYYTTAVYNGKYFEHFSINEITAALYGHKVDEIVEVELIMDEDQTKPLSNDTSISIDYWGWFDNRQNKFTIIYAKYFLLNMCFPYGIKGSEEANEGKSYRLIVNKK